MTWQLTEEAIYRLYERLGMMYGDAEITPFQFEAVAMAAFRWQHKHDKDGAKFPVHGPKSKIMEAQ